MKLTQIILLVFLMSIGTVGTIYLLQKKPEKNGFKREHVYTAKRLNTIELKYNSYYLNGLSSTRIFLGSTQAPRLLLSCNYGLRDTLTEKLPFSFNQAIDWRLARTQIDSPEVYLTEYGTPSFVSAIMPFNKEKIHNLKGLRFDLMQVLSPGSLIVNGFDPGLKQKALQKIVLQPERQLQALYPHQVQQNSNFSIDGFMSYNKPEGKIIFTYYYRNRFVCLDTNLNVLYTGNTIDTNSMAKIKVAALTSAGKKVHTMASPPLKVNHSGYSDGEFMYNHAALAADNEPGEMFEQNDVLDVYALANGKYSHSIYLPKHKGQKLREFALKGNILVALYEHHLITYKLPSHTYKSTLNHL